MPENQPEKLTVTVSGQFRFIMVPSARAETLMKFLRAQGIATSWPESCYTGTDSLVLGKGTNIKTVQTLLDQWV